MNSFFNILFFVLFLFPTQENSLYNKRGKPSTYGINQYIKNYQENIISEYEYKIDTIYDVFIFTENLSQTEGGDELGVFYIPDIVIITNEEKFVAYEFKDLSKFRQKTIFFTDRTVKAVIFHELTHAYFNQTLVLMKNKNMFVSAEYGTFRMFPNPNSKFGAEFIEEGICEYVIYHLNESAPLKNILIPDNQEDLLDESNRVNNIYCYSVVFLRDFLDKYGLKKGIEILLSNRPPTYEEMLIPELFFKRLQIN